jgi:hypothetical protein
MSKIVGRSGSKLLVRGTSFAVIYDTEASLIIDSGKADELAASRVWKNTNELISPEANSLVASALQGLEAGTITAAGRRLFTIPSGVKAEAKKALAWRKEEKRGGTPVGLNTARTLARGGQIGLEKVRHIAKYFPRHEVDKKGKGWSPGEDNFPSNGRIAWALWGGDAGWRWARAIVEREDKKAMKADAYVNKLGADVSAFKRAFENGDGLGPEFIARVRMDGTGIDRIYKVDLDGQVYFWDDGSWDDLGYVDGDIWTYDKSLDDPYDTVAKQHITIDPESAVVICARLQTLPFDNVSVFDIDAEEAKIAQDYLINEIDEIDFIDRVITAAGETGIKVSDADGVYTPEERSQKASQQVRNAAGRFSKQGSRVTVNGNRQGTITSINPANKSVVVKYDDGSTETVPASSTRAVQDSAPVRSNVVDADIEDITPLDVSGILGEPRTPIDRPLAQMPGTLPALTRDDLSSLIANWPSWVQSQRNAFAPLPVSTQASKNPNDLTKEYQEDLYKKTGIKHSFDPYDHPLLKKFFSKKDREGRSPNAIYAAATKDERPKELTPATSDIQPLYMAIVSPEDLRAVMDLVALIPASSKSNEPMTYVRKDKKWVREPKILADLNSATPPPVVPLDIDTLDSVLKQADGLVASAYTPDLVLTVLWGPNKENIEDAILAAGGLDRNRGNAEELRKYWTRGKGGAKIRWGTPGDWTRCVRNLRKYIGPRAKGYCALRHKEMNGVWPGDRKNRQKFSSNGKLGTFSTQFLNNSETVLSVSTLTASGDFSEEFNYEGSKFIIPLVIPEELESGDGRKFKKGSISFRELPLPLMWQIKTDDGHTGSVVVGRIDHMERTEQGIGNAYGVFDTGPYAKEVERLVKYKFIRGVSADMDQFEAEEHEDTNDKENAKKSKDSIGKTKISINKARVMGVTIVPKPAFQECQIFLEAQGDGDYQEDTLIPTDGIYVDEMEPQDASSLVACGMVASSIPVAPPIDWFNNPKLDRATPLTVDDDGRVYGHIAAWHVDHIGLPFGTKPPRSRSKYAYFHTGVVRTEDGSDVPVGQLTLAGGHASLEASAAEAVKHYDDTASAVADVHAGEDQFGIWVAGSLRPGTGPEQIRTLRASAPSGDWRPIRGSLELVAVCQVNVPGFPIARARVASGAVVALVAAGASVLAKLKADPVSELSSRVQKLESMNLLEERGVELAAIKAKFEEVKAEFAYDDFAFISSQTRKKLAKSGMALPDGSFPIRNSSDLKNAIQSYGRASKEKRASVRRHIIKRARALKKYDLVPQDWKSASADGITASVDAMRAKIESVSASGGHATPAEVFDPKKAIAPAKVAGADSKKIESLANEEEIDPITGEPILPTSQPAPVENERVGTDGRKDEGIYTAKSQPRDQEGKFRKVLARLKQDLGTAGLQSIVEEVKYVEGLNKLGNYEESSNAAGKLIDIVDRLDAGSLNKISLENVRSSARELGKVIANLPLGFDNQARKVRYSDLPPALRDLMDDMITRVEDKIGKEDADIATEALRAFKGGSDVFSQGEISAQMGKLLRLLT